MNICLGVSHLDHATLYGASEDTFSYLIKAAYAFSKTKNWSFNAQTFNKYGSDLVQELQVLNEIRCAADLESFDKFMQSERSR